MNVRAALLLLGPLSCAVGCPAGAPPPEVPPDIRYGVDPCDRCGMIVSEERFSAGYVTSASAPRRFDDLGCMASYLVEAPEPVSAFWVRDHESRAWLRGPQATYVRTTSIVTPMGTGIVACGDAARARALADRDGVAVLDFEALRGLGARTP